jgi:hypothetical protein
MASPFALMAIAAELYDAVPTHRKWIWKPLAAAPAARVLSFTASHDLEFQWCVSSAARKGEGKTLKRNTNVKAIGSSKGGGVVIVFSRPFD